MLVEILPAGTKIKIRISADGKDGQPEYLNYDDDPQLREDISGSLAATIFADLHEILERHASREGVPATPFLRKLTDDAEGIGEAFQRAQNEQIAKVAAQLVESQAA